MYANIAVLTYQPPETDFYTYKIPQNLKLKPGQLVEVPFGKRKPLGIVLKIESQKPQINYELKEVSQIILETPIITNFQIELLKWMSAYYHAPMINCLEAMLPKIPKRIEDIKKQQNLNQTLIIVPNINSIPQISAAYPKAKNSAIYHNELKVSERFKIWQKTFLGEYDYIFGTRSAIFLPFKNLKKIIIYQEHEEAYKDERSPYFDTLTIAEKLQEQTGASLEIIDSSPKVTTYFNHKEETIIPKLKKEPNIKIVSMGKEREFGNKSPISELLESYLKAAYIKNKKVLLFLNKKKDSGHLYCKSCKLSKYLSVKPQFCPNCKSKEIWFNSLNVESLSNLVKTIVPKAKIKIVEKEKTDSQIDIGTSAVLYSLLTQKYDLVAHIAADSTINVPDFSSGQKTYNLITSLKKITKGLLLIQTYNPQNTTITSAAFGKYLKYYAAEVEERKSLSYPPYALLIKLTLSGKRDEAVEEKAQNLIEKLLKNDDPDVSILGPYKPVFVAKKQKYNIILKAKVRDYGLKSREKGLEKLSPYLKLIPKNWQITVEPKSIN